MSGNTANILKVLVNNVEENIDTNIEENKKYNGENH